MEFTQQVRFMVGVVDWLVSVPGLRVPLREGPSSLCNMGHIFAVLQFLLFEEDFRDAPQGLFDERADPVRSSESHLTVPRALSGQVSVIEGVLSAHIEHSFEKLAAKKPRPTSHHKIGKILSLCARLNLTRLAIFSNLDDLAVLCELLLRLGTHSGCRTGDCLIAYKKSAHYNTFNAYLVSRYVIEGGLASQDLLSRNESLETEYQAKKARLERQASLNLIRETNNFNMERMRLVAETDLLQAKVSELEEQLAERGHLGQLSASASAREHALQWELKLLVRALEER